MDLTKEQSQRKEFCDILFELAKNQEMLKDKATRHEMYKRLEGLYYSPIKEKKNKRKSQNRTNDRNIQIAR